MMFFQVKLGINNFSYFALFKNKSSFRDLTAAKLKHAEWDQMSNCNKMDGTVLYIRYKDMERRVCCLFRNKR